MTLRDDLVAKKNRIEKQLTILDRVGEDTYPIGTIVLFSAESGDKWYYLKVDEESWRYLSSVTGIVKQLRQWVLEAEQSGIGYFEIYKLLPDKTPFYVSMSE
jgi:hypothetical protein